MLLKNKPAFMIRKYDSKDRQSVRRICCETALMGEPSTAFFDDDEIFADTLTAYFTDYEPESCFVAECGNNVIGYILGAKDSMRINRIFIRKIAPGILIKALRRGVFFHGKNARFLFHILLSLARGEFKSPAFSEDYPAILHINITKGYRAGGVGSGLINAYLDYLRVENVKGVHLATMSDKAGRFFSKLDFQLLFQGVRSYYRYFLGKDIPVYIYGRQVKLRDA